jgi:hypothetical protein
MYLPIFKMAGSVGEEGMAPPPGGP